MERNTTATRTLVILLAVVFALFFVATSCKSPTSSEPTGDTKAPTVASITSTKGDPTGDSPIDVTIVFSEAVIGFEETDLTLTNATSSNFVAANKKTFTVDLTPVAEGTVILDIAAKVCKDRAGNRNKALGTAFSRAYTQKPFATISSTTTPATNVSPIPITITFNQPVDNFEQADVTPTNCTISNFQNTIANLEWTADLADPSELAPVEAAVPAGVCYKQGTLVPNVASATFSRTYDKTPPDPSLSSSEPEPTNTSIQITITFLEEVTDFTAGDITVSGGGNVDNWLTSDNKVFTADVTPSLQGSVTISLAADVCTDLAGNGNTAAPSSIIRTYDSVNPTVSITSTASSSTNVSPIPITITFAESVTGFDVGDLTVVNGTKGVLSGGPAEYTCDITPAAEGTVTVDIAADACQDAAGNNNTAAAQFIRTYDTIKPNVGITSTTQSRTGASPIPITITFDEDVTGFDENDLTVVNGTKGTVSGGPKAYTCNITPTAAAVTVDLDGGLCQDAAGNTNSAATTFTRTYITNLGYDTATQANAPNVDTVSISSFTVAPNSNRVLIVAVYAKAGSETVPGIQKVYWGTTEMALVTGSEIFYTKPAPQPRGGKAALYYLKDPTAGTDSVTATFDAAYSTVQIGAISLYDAYVHSGNDPIGAVAKTNAGAGKTIVSTNITTKSNYSWLVDMVAGDGAAGGFTADAGQTSRWSQSTGAGCSAGSTKPTTTASPPDYSMGWTLGNAQTNALLQSVAEIKIAQ